MMIEIMMNSLIAFMLIGGTIMSALAVVGILRLPDMYSRLHATTKSTTLGVIMIMAGAFLYFWYVEGLIETNLLLGARSYCLHHRQRVTCCQEVHSTQM